MTLSVEPNPASGAATIRLALPSPGAVRGVVFDARGREVAVVASGPARLWRALVRGGHVASGGPGVYVVRAVVGDEVASGRFVVAR